MFLSARDKVWQAEGPTGPDGTIASVNDQWGLTQLGLSHSTNCDCGANVSGTINVSSSSSTGQTESSN